MTHDTKATIATKAIRGPIDINGNPGRASLWAIAISAVMLVTAVLPAEYGIDWTGVGRVLGLTSMGERKMAAAGARGDAKAATAAEPAATVVRDRPTEQYATLSKRPLRVDEIDVRLAPKGQVEYKTDLAEGEFLLFTWNSGGANVKFDFHGEPAAGPDGAFLSFQKGIASQSGGSLKAPFTGTHGWYWKNPTDSNVTIKLRVSGFYSQIRKM